MTNTSLTFSAHDWRLTDRFAGFTVFDLHGEWLRGDWWTVTLAILGLRVTLTRWLVVAEESPWTAVAGAAIGGYVGDGIPVESLGREKAP